jgi:hypothetical protein
VEGTRAKRGRRACIRQRAEASAVWSQPGGARSKEDLGHEGYQVHGDWAKSSAQRRVHHAVRAALRAPSEPCGSKADTPCISHLATLVIGAHELSLFSEQEMGHKGGRPRKHGEEEAQKRA